MSLFSKISSLLSGDNLDKAIALGFSRFDKDQSGFIEKSEVLGVIETIVKTTGLNWAPPGALIDGVFSKAGGPDGKVDKEEFSALVRQLFSLAAEQKKAEEGAPATA